MSCFPKRAGSARHGLLPLGPASKIPSLSLVRPLTPPHSVPHFWVPGCRSTSFHRAASRRHVQLRATKKTYDSFDAMIRDDSTPILVDFYGETAARLWPPLTLLYKQHGVALVRCWCPSWTPCLPSAALACAWSRSIQKNIQR